jgi:hypothetical protein
MNVSIASASVMPVLNTSTMASRRADRNEQLADKHYDKIDEHYEVKRSDWTKNRASFQDQEETKYIAEINAYLSLKRRVEYGLYQYGKFLGYNLDVSV